MRVKNRYASETDEHQARLDDLRTRTQERYASKTHEQHQAHLDDLRTRAQERYASEPDEQYQVCLEDARMRVQERLPLNLMNKDNFVYHVSVKETMKQEARKQTSKRQQDMKG